jgi:hypothetical protein
MDAVVLIGFVVLLVIAVRLLLNRAKGFVEPSGMSDEQILSAIAGQADWLERQALHVAKFGGNEPHSSTTTARREYIYRLCEALVMRHPAPRNLFYNATKRAAQLEAEGVPREKAVVSAVKERLFTESGHVYVAKWHT